ncbi:MAG: ABC transporter ATP-binding protein [Deltaproteobacteria bacterium]|nr:ABC transporter ATP-binding protein [Deltaproteobacteria bacterium]
MTTPLLRLAGVSKHFGKFSVIEDVNLEVVQGERHALIGPNGAGKSTLFNLITGKYFPTEGTIYFKGEQIDHLPPHKVNRLGISRSFQIINIFKEMTVYENVRNAVVAKHRLSLRFTRPLSAFSFIREETEHMLGRINLTPFRDEPAGTLGYSQQRALEIGMTIAQDPELVLLDEPGAGLSPEETKEIVKLIREVTARKTLLIVEHDMDVVFNLADRISVLNWGRIVLTETPEQIKNNEMVKEVYLGNLFEPKGH